MESTPLIIPGAKKPSTSSRRSKQGGRTDTEGIPGREERGKATEHGGGLQLRPLLQILAALQLQKLPDHHQLDQLLELVLHHAPVLSLTPDHNETGEALLRHAQNHEMEAERNEETVANDQAPPVTGYGSLGTLSSSLGAPIPGHGGTYNAGIESAIQRENSLSAKSSPSRPDSVKLSEEGTHVVLAVRSFLQALRDWNTEKNKEDQMQTLIWKLKQGDYETNAERKQDGEPVAGEDSLKGPFHPRTVPTQKELLNEFRTTVSTIVKIILTSPPMRAAIFDGITLAKDWITGANESSSLEGMGLPSTTRAKEKEPEEIAEDIMAATSASIRDYKQEQGNNGREPVIVLNEQHTSAYPTTQDTDPPQATRKRRLTVEEYRDDCIDRFKQAIAVVQSDSKYRHAVLTFLSVLQSYGKSIVTSAQPVVPSAADHLPRPSLFVPILEPYSGGPGAFGPLTNSFQHLCMDQEVSLTRFSHLGSDLKRFVEKALLDQHYLYTTQSSKDLNKLYSDMQEILSDSPQFQKDLMVFLTDLEIVIKDVCSDEVLGKVFVSFTGLVVALEKWIEQATRTLMGGAMKAAEKGVWGDLVEWVIPKIGGVIRDIPLPRLEFTSPELDLAIDAPPFLSTSFVPDSVRVDQSTSLVITPAASTVTPSAPGHQKTAWFGKPVPVTGVPLAIPTTSTSIANSSTSIAILGLRMHTVDIGYWLRYKGPCGCFSVTESGLLDLHFGGEKKGGFETRISFDTSKRDQFRKQAQDSRAVAEGLNSNLNTEEENLNDQQEGNTRPPLSLFEVTSTFVHIESFDLKPHQSSHPWLMWAIKPVMRRILRAQLEKALKEQLQKGLDVAGIIGWKAKEEVRKGELEDLNRFGELKGKNSIVMSWVSAIWTAITSKQDDGEEEGYGDSSAHTEINNAAPPEATIEAEEVQKEPLDIHLTTKGIILDLESGGGAAAASSNVALDTQVEGEQAKEQGTIVGLGAEGVVLPVGSASTPAPRPSLSDIAQDHTQQAVDDVRDGIQGLQSAARDLEAVNIAVRHFDKTLGAVEAEDESMEKEGWRSAAFDWVS